MCVHKILNIIFYKHLENFTSWVLIILIPSFSLEFLPDPLLLPYDQKLCVLCKMQCSVKHHVCRPYTPEYVAVY